MVIKSENGIIAVDFDGTIVEHAYPNLGEPVPKAIEVLRTLQKKGWRIILWTMRSGETLDQAVRYCLENGIQLFGVNENPDQKSWTSSPKAYAHFYIDDAAFGCPLVHTLSQNGEALKRPYVDWEKVAAIFLGPAGL